MTRSGQSPARPAPAPDVTPPEPTRLGEVVWLEPYPDLLLEGLPDKAPGPEARYELRESISLAFITALQLLPARQRAALVLRDVLGFRAAEAASILDTTEESVTSALKRARATLSRRPSSDLAEPPAPSSAAKAEIVSRLTRAWEAADIDGVIALLRDDVLLTMPPMPLEYQGRDLAAAFLAAVAFRRGRRYQFVPTRANGAPAFGVYQHGPHEGDAHAVGLLVITLAGRRSRP